MEKKMHDEINELNETFNREIIEKDEIFNKNHFAIIEEF
jgi:hypothetical protein